MKKLKLNCDLGEGYGIYRLLDENSVMPFIDQANIACGFHAGDPIVIQESIECAVSHGVEIGAHPSYPDRQGFGRRSMQLSENELIAMLIYQISALQGMVAANGSRVQYVKPHGALYNDLIVSETVRKAVFRALQQCGNEVLPLMVLAGPHQNVFDSISEECGVTLLFEGFADRKYTTEGTLVPRAEKDAVLSTQEAIDQAHNFALQTRGFQVDSLCVHGDTEDAIALVKAIRKQLNESD